MLQQNLYTEQIAALKLGEKEKSNTLRFALAAIKNREIEKKSDLTDEEVVVVLQKIARELKESIIAFGSGKREDLKQQSIKQLEILSVYLPKEMSDENLKTEIEKIIKENNEIFVKNKKAIIGIVMKQLRGKADSQKIMKILNTIFLV